MDYIIQEKDYWIHQDALSITLNALGGANRIQCSVVSGAVIRVFVENVDAEDTLGYNAAHSYKSWLLSASPTFFSSDTEKYVYVAIPKTTTIGTRAIVVFPSELLDIYGKNAEDVQIGSTDYYYIYIYGHISAVETSGGYSQRRFITDPREHTGKLDTPQGDKEALANTDWYHYSKVDGIVTFLKRILMGPESWFQTLRLGSADNVLRDVAKSDSGGEYIDSDTMVATPGYVESQYLSKTHPDTAAAKITFREGLDAKHIRVTGSNGTTPDVDNITQKEVGLEVEQSGVIGGIFRVAKSILTKTVQSLNFSGGDSLTGTGWQLTDNYGNGRSRLVVDDAVFRGKVTLNALEVRKLIAMGGNYVFSPAASIIEQVDYYGYVVVPGEPEPAIELLGYEYVKVPWMLRLIPLSLRGRYLSKKKWVRSTMRQEDYSRVTFYRCWLKADDGSTQTINTWKEGMLARCQTFDTSQIENGDHSGKYDSPDSGLHGKDVTNKLYWRAVIATAQGVDKDNYQGQSIVLDDGRKHNYIDLSNTSQDGVQLYLSGSDHVSAGDHIVCFGDWKDANLSHFVTIDTIGDDAPAVKEFRGVGYTDGASIDWSLDGKCKTKISPVAGNAFYAPHFYVETEGSVRDVATFMVSTDGILSEVKSVQSNGKNLLSGVMTGNGWKSGTYEDGIFEYDNDADFDSNGEWISPAEGDTLIVSPEIVITKRHYYTASAYIEGSQTVRVAIIQVGHSPELKNVTGTGRVYATTELTAGTYRIVVKASKIRHAQVELADDIDFVPTAFDASSTEVSSRIKQTADNYNVTVKNEFKAAGLDITYDKVQLLGGLVEFMGGQNNATKYVSVSLDENYMPHFIFYAPDGTTPMYDLGYTGLTQLVNNSVSDRYDAAMLLAALSGGSYLPYYSDGDNIDSINPKSLYYMEDSNNSDALHEYPVWFFFEGYTINGQGTKIWTHGGSYDRSYVKTRNYTDELDNGWYFIFSEYSQNTGIMKFRVIHTVSGKIDAECTAYAEHWNNGSQVHQGDVANWKYRCWIVSNATTIAAGYTAEDGVDNGDFYYMNLSRLQDLLPS